MLASVDDDWATLRTLALPILMVQDSAAHGALPNQLHLLVVELVVESKAIEVCFLHSICQLLLLARPLFR